MSEEYRQGPPYCIQIELTEGCNLRCLFCGINGIREKPGKFKFMDLLTARAIATDLGFLVQYEGWNPRLEFAMHGEPTMNPDCEEIIKIFRQELPKTYMLMESNGGGLIKDPMENVLALFRAGITTLALDEYQNINFVPKIWNEMMKEGIGTGKYVKAGPNFKGMGTSIIMYDYPACGPEGNPHQRQNYTRLVRVRPIDESTSGTHATLNNHTGCGSPRNENAAGKRCAKPFREMSIRWDGGVAVCCNDWRGYLPIGNVIDTDIESVWDHPVMYAARRKLYAGERDFGPCAGCDALSYRPGLLPDHKGQEILDAPSQKDEDLLSAALAEGPMTEPVLRPWEKQIDAFQTEQSSTDAG